MKWKIAILALISGAAVCAKPKSKVKVVAQVAAAHQITKAAVQERIESAPVSKSIVVAWDLHKVLFTEQGKSGHDCKPRNEMFALVKELNEKGVRQVILSNISRESFAILRSKYPELFAYFDLKHSLAHAQGIFTRKPHKKYFEKFLNIVEVPAQSIIFVDDKSKNVEGARKVGLKAEQFISVKQLRNAFMKHAIL